MIKKIKKIKEKQIELKNNKKKIPQFIVVFFISIYFY